MHEFCVMCVANGRSKLAEYAMPRQRFPVLLTPLLSGAVAAAVRIVQLRMGSSS
jgi:hypothetical protein